MGLVNFQFKVNSDLHLPHAEMEFSEITPDVFVGTNQCCRRRYKLSLLDKGVTHDISLEGEHVDAPYGAESYLWLPTADHAAPSRMSLMLGTAYIDDVLAVGGKVYVHCKNGHGRGPTLVAAWLVLHGKTVDEAVALIASKRPETHIEPVQLKALRTFEHDARTKTKNP